MRISEQWLREWIDPPVDTQTLAEQLTMAGLEVDTIEPAAPAFSGVVVAEVISVAAHPDADKLRLCQVDAGDDESLQIVCGAANVRPGLRVALARVGAELPGGVRIRKGKLRGVASLGMLCSARELGLAEESSGLLELSGEAPLGSDLRRALDLDDQIIEVDLTPNRGDCLGMLGIAREVAVLNDMPLQVPEVPAVPVVTGVGDFPVRVADTTACPRYLGRVIRGIDRTRPSPMWLRERLRRAGIRPIEAVVDVTNYLLLEYGQPLHAFDLNRLQSGIDVRMANPGERLILLDGREVELQPDTLVIADASGPLALAGIMGGAASAVAEGTTDLFLECAYFEPTAIIGKARGYGLQTDASYRFERGVDPGLQALALERATALILALTGGEAGPVIEVENPAALPNPAPITLRQRRVNALLGLALPADEIERILQQLGMTPELLEAGVWQVLPPSARFDLRIEADLIEELARIHGYQRIPSRLPLAPMSMPAVSEQRTPVARLVDALVDLGLQEVITYSFIDPQWQTLFDPEAAVERLANPLASDLAVMRSSLWPGLVQVAAHNLKRQHERVAVFEVGRRFVWQDNELLQDDLVSGLLCGRRDPEQWAQTAAEVDFFDAKGVVEQLAEVAGRADDLAFQAAEHPALHPGQCARLRLTGEAVGWLGRLHPRLAARLKLPQGLYLFELTLAPLTRRDLPSFEPVSRFPLVRRDLSLEVPESLPAEALCRHVRERLGKRLAGLTLFDLYAGGNLESGKKSIGLGLLLQDPSRTLTDTEVDAAVADLLQAMGQELAIRLRA